MQALVILEGIVVNKFYQMSEEESQSAMHQRIIDIINYRYPFCNFDIKWL